jgi:hypothetical protein
VRPRRTPGRLSDSVEGWQFTLAKQGRLRRDGAVVELVVGKSSVGTAVTKGPEHGKLKNPHC